MADEQGHSNEKEDRKAPSKFVLALFAFLLTNVSLQVLMSGPIYRYANLLFRQNQEVMKELAKGDFSGIAFIGSSVIEVPLALLDGRHGWAPRPVNVEKFLGQALHKESVCRDFSLEAGLISDQYLVLHEFAQGRMRPDTVLFGIAPRDFYDTRWPLRSQTCTFRALGTFSRPLVCAKYLDNFNEYGEYFLFNSVFLYRMRSLVIGGFNIWLHKFMPAPATGVAVAEQAGPATQKDEPNEEVRRMTASLTEYRSCYCGIDRSPKYQQQMQFFGEALSFARSASLKVLLVNLPLTAQNKELLPPGMYDRFRRDVKSAVDKSGTLFLDLSEDKDFTTDDFYDSAHLGEKGCRKFLQKAVPLLKTSLCRN